MRLFTSRRRVIARSTRPTRWIVHAANLLLLSAYFAYWGLWRLDAPGVADDELGVVQPFLDLLHGRLLWVLGPYHGITESFLAGPFLLIFGRTQFALRLCPFFYSLVSIPLYYFLTLKFFGKTRWAFVATWLLASSPLFIMATRMGLWHGTLMFPLLLAGALLFQGWIENGRPSFLIGASVFAGLALGTRSWLYALAIAIVLTALVFRWRRKVLDLRQALRQRVLFGAASLLIVLASGLPFVAWNMFKTTRHLYPIMTRFTTAGPSETAMLQGGPHRAPDWKDNLRGAVRTFNGLLEQTSYQTRYFASPPEANVFAARTFWACCLALLFLGFRKVARGGPQKNIRLEPLVVLFFYICVAGLPIRHSDVSHYLCVYLLYPWILVGAFQGSSDMIKSHAVTKGLHVLLIVCVTMISIPNARILRKFQTLLDAGHGQLSPAVKELVYYARAADIRTLVVPGGPNPLAALIAFYGKDRIPIEMAEPPESIASMIEGPEARHRGFVTIYDRAICSVPRVLAAARLPEKSPHHKEKVFYGKDGRPVLGLYLPSTR